MNKDNHFSRRRALKSYHDTKPKARISTRDYLITWCEFGVAMKKNVVKQDAFISLNNENNIDLANTDNSNSRLFKFLDCARM